MAGNDEKTQTFGIIIFKGKVYSFRKSGDVYLIWDEYGVTYEVNSLDDGSLEKVLAPPIPSVSQVANKINKSELPNSNQPSKEVGDGDSKPGMS